MRKKTVCCFSACLLMILIFFGNLLLCHGAEAEESPQPTPTPDVPVIKSVSVSPGTAVVSKDSTCAFTAVVSGENDYSSEVAWSVSGQKSQNTFIDSRGVLNVGAEETASSLVVKAVSKQDSNFSAQALVSVRRTDYSIQVKASPDNGGTVSGGGSVEEGGYTVLSASPNDGYAFDGWSLNGVAVSRESRYVVDDVHSSRTYVANFKSSSCRINVTVNDSSAGTATESQTVEYGESLTLEASAQDGCRFDGWMENGEIISRDYRMQLNNITGSRDFVAVFSRNRFTLTLAALPSEAGAVSGQGTYEKGSNVKIIATPAQGYRFTGWTENGSSVSANQEYYVENLSRDMYFVANFEAKTYTINAGVSSPNGTITPEGKSTVAEGGEISYTITPKGGYTVKAVYVDGKSVGAVSSYSFTDVKGNHNISAEFTAASGKGNSGTQEQKNKEDKTEKNKKDEDEVDKKSNDEVKKEEDNPDSLAEDEEDELTGTLQYFGISLEEAEQMIDMNNDKQLMLGAFSTGDLQVTVQNDFADSGQKISRNSFGEDSGIMNLDKVLGGMLTKGEKLEMLKGKAPIAVTLRIKDVSGVEPEQIVRIFEENKLPERKIVQYFEMSLTKSGKDDAQEVSVLPKKLWAVINVPEHLKAAGRDFYVLRLHTGEDGETEYTELADEDDSPDTITFATDRFSSYAVAYTDRQPEKAEVSGSPKDISGSRAMVNIIVIFATIFATGVTVFLVIHLVRQEIIRRRG